MKSRLWFLKDSMGHERLLALTDGVYAIAITLLVLNLKVPELPGITNPLLKADLLRQLPNFVAYAIAFLVIAFFWLNHNRIFRSVTKCDERAIRLNFIHLLFVSLTPYTTSLIGHYEEDRVATVVFSLNLGLASLSLAMLALHVLARDDWRTDESGGTWLAIPWWSAYAGPLVAVISIVVSFVNITVALLLWTVVILGRGFILKRDSAAVRSKSELPHS